jgi:predicted acyl esterase
MTQLAAATQQPPHLKAIFPFDATIDAWDAAWHNGLFSNGFITPWTGTLGVLAGHGDRLFRGPLARLARKILTQPAVHRRFAKTDGGQALRALRLINRLPRAAQPWDDLWRSMAVEHQTRDDWWERRSLTATLPDVRIPVYLGSEWSNVPLHLGGTLAAWDLLRDNPHARLAVLAEHSLPWPWESMHVEALAWFDQWLKGHDTGILDGPRVRYWMPGAEEWRTSDTWPPPAGYREFPLGDEDRSYATYLPQSLTWTGDALAEDLDVAGPIELRLDATITADDTGWIVLLQDVAPDGTVTDVTEGWLRAALREVDEAASRPGAPVLPLRTPVAVPAGEKVTYRIPLVPNARRFGRGHRLRVTVTSDDTRREAHVMLRFTHTPIGTRSVNTVHASSRLLLPVLSERR